MGETRAHPSWAWNLRLGGYPLLAEEEASILLPNVFVKPADRVREVGLRALFLTALVWGNYGLNAAFRLGAICLAASMKAATSFRVITVDILNIPLWATKIPLLSSAM